MPATTPPSGGDTLAPEPSPSAAEKPVVTVAEMPVIGATAEDVAIRPFEFRATDEQLQDLKRRVAATR